jgi:hypothetical protein
VIRSLCGVAAQSGNSRCRAPGCLARDASSGSTGCRAPAEGRRMHDDPPSGARNGRYDEHGVVRRNRSRPSPWSAAASSQEGQARHRRLQTLRDSRQGAPVTAMRRQGEATRDNRDCVNGRHPADRPGPRAGPISVVVGSTPSGFGRDRPVGFENPVTPPRRTHEPHRRDGHDDAHEVACRLTTRPMRAVMFHVSADVHAARS